MIFISFILSIANRDAYLLPLWILLVLVLVRSLQRLFFPEKIFVYFDILLFCRISLSGIESVVLNYWNFWYPGSMIILVTTCSVSGWLQRARFLIQYYSWRSEFFKNGFRFQRQTLSLLVWIVPAYCSLCSFLRKGFYKSKACLRFTWTFANR